MLDKSDHFVAPCQPFSLNSHALSDCQIAIATLEILTKFGIADSVAVRPFIQFYNSNGGSASIYGASVTYNFNNPNSGLIPYLGLGAAAVTTTGSSSGNGGLYFEGGIDYNASENFVINANYKQGDAG